MVTLGAVCLWLDLGLCTHVVRRVSCVMVTYGAVYHGDTRCGISLWQDIERYKYMVMHVAVCHGDTWRGRSMARHGVM